MRCGYALSAPEKRLRPASWRGDRVIKVLRANNIEIASVHNHMLDEEPRLIFMHFWANDDALKLAKGLRAALMKRDPSGTENVDRRW